MGKLSKNILLLSTGDVNGAYESIYKLAYFLKDQGHTVCLVVKNKTRKDDFIVKYTAEQNKTIKKTFVIRLGFKIKNKIYRREKS
ncbi:hypothetical protein ACQ9BO_26005 [Flavobacterium sp. P21]|uniref:hypothetical protein n=1 Tax=Flavobacterium sp. P21 TaxID=3423948 RepID=UPI003D67FF26